MPPFASLRGECQRDLGVSYEENDQNHDCRTDDGRQAQYTSY